MTLLRSLFALHICTYNRVNWVIFFSCTAPQWTSDAEALPLQYAFGVLVEKDFCETFGVPSSDPEREQIIPQGSGPEYILPLCVVVSDKFGSFVLASVNITSSPPDASDLTPVALESLLDDAVEAPLQSGDVDAALSALISIINTVQDSSNASGESDFINLHRASHKRYNNHAMLCTKNPFLELLNYKYACVNAILMCFR